MTNTFQDFGLHPELIKAVSELGFEVPTPIQSAAIPLLLDGRDVMGQAQTGTGKTAAFALPMLNAIVPHSTGVQGLVIAPTRELANQVSTAIYSYGQYRKVRVLPIYGGQSYSRQISRLERGVDIVVGTPGRMLDLIRKRVLDLSSVRYLVLDEADEMLSMGFVEDIEAILGEIPGERQSALFSATLPASVRVLADRYMVNPESIAISPESLTVPNTEQRCYVVRDSDKVAAVSRLLEAERVSSALIFARTRVGTAQLAEALSVRGFQAEALHGDLGQDAREAVLGRFRRKRFTCLVATDVAARGLDIEDISHVINYDLPLDPEYYVHRIGRTGRAGKDGIAISLVTPNEIWRLARIEKYMRSSIQRAELPSKAQVLKHRDDCFVGELKSNLDGRQLESERDLVSRLVASGCDPVDIAAAAIQLARAGESDRVLEDIVEYSNPAERRGRHSKAYAKNNGREERSRGKSSHESDMVRLSMNLGKAQQVHPGEIVGAIAGTARIPGQAIGAIRIGRDQTFVDVTEQHADRVLQMMRGWKVRGHTVVLQRAI